MDYKYLGLTAIVLLLVGLCFVVWRWPQGKHLTFSQHVALHKSAIVYYFFLFAVTLTLLDIFFIEWFTPTFRPSSWFDVFIVASSVFQITCTLVPEIKGWRTKWHQAFAGLSALFLLPVLAILIITATIAMPGRVLSGLALAAILALIIRITATRGKHTHLLLLQSAYSAVFFVPIVYISYVTKPIPTITSYEDARLIIYECTQPIQAKQGFVYNLDGKHAGLVPADTSEFKAKCRATGIE